MGVWPQPCRGEAWWGEEDMVSGVAPGFARTQLCVETEVLQCSAPTIQLPWATLWTCIQAAPPPRGDSLVAQTSHCIQAGCRQGFACSAIDPGLIPGLGRSPGEGNGYPLQYSCLKNVMDRRSLAGHSPWGHKESDVAEWLTLSPTLRKVGMQQGAGRRDTLP